MLLRDHSEWREDDVGLFLLAIQCLCEAVQVDWSSDAGFVVDEVHD